VVGGAASARVSEYLFDQDVWRVRRPMQAAWHSGGSTSLAVPSADHEQVWQTWLVGGQGPGGVSRGSLYYDHTEEPWHRLADMPLERFAGAAAALNGLIYITGGRHHTDENSCYVFDPERDSYTACAPLPAVHKGAGAAAVADRVFVIGGHNNFGQAIPTVHAYDPVVDQWSEVASMLTGRRDPAVAVLDGKVYVIGGDNNGPVQTVEIYDPVDDSWTSTSVLPARRTGAAAVVASGLIYVFGGVGQGGTVLDSVLRFNPQTEVWTTLGQALTSPWSHGGALLVGDSLVTLMGGRDAGGAVRADLQTYDVQTLEAKTFACTTSSAMPTGLAQTAVVTHHSKAYLFGGTINGTEGLATVQKFHPGRIAACPIQCSSYAVLNTAWRNVSNGSGSNCDNGLNNTWYRLLAPAGTQLPTSPVAEYHCGTSATGWMNGSHPTVGSGIVSRTACFNWSGNTCSWSTSIQVLNCGSYYVYRLPNAPVCSLAYCAE
jgi:N-acetylneuraminic acid mutarotase